MTQLIEDAACLCSAMAASNGTWGREGIVASLGASQRTEDLADKTFDLAWETYWKADLAWETWKVRMNAAIWALAASMLMNSEIEVP